jgi:hypothetical protein
MTDDDREHALAAPVIAKVVFVDCPSGPLVCLALEICTRRSLPSYCYWPLNLRKHSDIKFLYSLAHTQQLQLRFVLRKGAIPRECGFADTRCRQIERRCNETVDALKTCEKPYQFVRVVAEFETIYRVPQFFERQASESELSSVMDSIRTDAENLSGDKRALAHQIVHGCADILRTHWGDDLRKQIEAFPSIRAGLLLLSDIQQWFGDDYYGFASFFADCLAVNTKEEVLRKGSDWPPKLEALVKAIKKMGLVPQAEQTNVWSDVFIAFSEVLADLQSGRDLSVSMLQGVFRPLRPLLPGQVGRRPKDYSREYDWKHSMSWTQVARKSLTENPDIRDEFGARTFDSLSLEEQQALTSRIREGVRSYAQRTGKPFPIESALTKKDLQEID